METDPFSSSDLFAMALLPHLIAKLVNRGALLASDVAEAADGALFQMEQHQGAFPGREQDFEIARAMLDQPVDDARHAELSDPAIRLGYFDPLDRLRLIGSREQLRPNIWPVLAQVILGVVSA
jgi:hypothetical protein